MFKKTITKPIKKAKPTIKSASTKPEQITITEALKQKVFPYIVADFANALKSLKSGESIRFGKLGTFKKTKRAMPELKKVGRPRKVTPIAEIPAQPAKVTNGHLTFKESKRTIVLTWGKYSITLLCITAVAISVIHKLNF
ncbi:2412_t:CDS:2 [Ambispora gerdemannii]|uniref:2412_t:CDS:1 n=1 Tax=Ambispora gerdemannii TaxID=144530 RepID=A0A9N9AF00_9GLOM|nr:2412_t:CDS:2 [Ambispora gerdemannii]